MKCIFCDCLINSSNRSREHVIPQWIIRKLNIEKKQLAFWGISPTTGISKTIKPTPNTFVHKICGTCNNGWLHDIDDSCIEVANWMMSYSKEKESLTTFNQNSIHQLYTFIYKIFLNYFATSPESYRKDKLILYKNFYENKYPFTGTEFFFCTKPADENFAINHSNNWMALEPSIEVLNGDDFPDFTLGFKFYIQLGAVAFVLCNTGTENFATVYDPSMLIPLVVKSTSISQKMNYEICIPPTPNTPENLILFNSLRLSLKKLNT